MSTTRSHPRPPVTLVASAGSWLGGGKYLRQLREHHASETVPGDLVVGVGSWRGGPADIRLPLQLVERLSPAAFRAAGRVLWRRHGCVHRANLDIPPAGNEILSVLDLAPFHFADEGAIRDDLGEQIRRARGVVALSETIREEILERFAPRGVWILPPEVHPRFFADAPLRHVDRPPFVLHVGGATTRKGLDRLAAAWPAIAEREPDLQLLMVGPAHADGRALLGSQTRVTWRGQLDDESLLSLMAAARAVVVPSAYEGFGIPVAEGLALGTPVVVLSGTSCAEVGGEAAVVADAAGGVDALVVAILSAVHLREDDPARLDRGRARARRWSRNAVNAVQDAIYTEAFGVVERPEPGPAPGG